VFLNVIMNAVQAIPLGAADQNEIRVRTRTDERGRAVVEIEDTGAGMTAEALGEIFMPLFTTRAPAMGTGLGLSLSQRIVASLGGEIAFESEPGRGTRCRIVLPAGSPTVVGPSPPARPVVARRGRVLVVDDDPMTCTAIRRSLAGDHEVTTSHSGREALALVEAGFEYDVIVCDLLMPQMTGMELHRRLESDRPELAARMLFLSGGLFAPAAREFARTVEDRIIEKPFDPRRLREIVNSRLP
jgi:CheY-like chemotaxis protein